MEGRRIYSSESQNTGKYSNINIQVTAKENQVSQSRDTHATSLNLKEHGIDLKDWEHKV